MLWKSTKKRSRRESRFKENIRKSEEMIRVHVEAEKSINIVMEGKKISVEVKMFNIEEIKGSINQYKDILSEIGDSL